MFITYPSLLFKQKLNEKQFLSFYFWFLNNFNKSDKNKKPFLVKNKKKILKKYFLIFWDKTTFGLKCTISNIF